MSSQDLTPFLTERVGQKVRGNVAYAKSGVSLNRAYQILSLLNKTKPISFFASSVPCPTFKRGSHLVFSADGAGTKIELLSKLNLHWVSGWDAVAMNANDLICAGAQPLWFLDYFVQGRLDKKVFREVLKGINAALKVLGAALLGGETAEHPGMFVREELYDIGGFLVGLRPPEIKIGPEFVREGDVLIGLASSGPHANGFSLIRKVLDSKTVTKNKEALLAPTKLYHPIIWPLLRDKNLKSDVHSIAHITGGAFQEKIPRALPKNLSAKIDKNSWPIPPIFQLLCEKARMNFDEALGVWNLGIGLVLICGSQRIRLIENFLRKKRISFWKIGEVIKASSDTRIILD